MHRSASSVSSSSQTASGRQPYININRRPLLRNPHYDIVRVENDMNYFYPRLPSSNDGVDGNGETTPLRPKSIRHTRSNQFNFDGPRRFGPTKKRSCTDFGFLFLFVIFLAIWGGLLNYLLSHVNIEQVIFPSDTYGNICGKGEFSDRPYLYFFNILKCATDLEGTIIDGCQTPQVCVKQCPQVTFSVQPNNDVRDIELQHAICQYGIKPNRNNLYQLALKKLCAKYYFKSEPVGGRCVPSILHIINDRILDEIRNQTIKDDSPDGSITTREIVESSKGMTKLIQALTLANQLANDIVRTWGWILVGLLMTMMISFLWISLMQVLSRYMVWFSILALFILNIFIVYFCVNQYLTLISDKANETDLEPPNELDSIAMVNLLPEDAHRFIRTSKKTDLLDFDFKGLLKDSMAPYMESTKLWLILSVVFAVLLLIMTMVMICLCQRIRLAVAVIEEASKAVNTLKSTLGFPMVSFLLKLIVLIFALFAFITISTGSQPRYKNNITGNACVPMMKNDLSCTKTRPFDRSLVYLFHAFNLFEIIWLLFFVSGLCYVTLAGVFADYYWKFDKLDISFFALINSFVRCVRYHLGSIAFGSLLIAIVRFIRIILEYIDNKCKKYPDNCVSRFIMGCCKCCLWCLEKFIKFINKNAYIMMAVHGKNFCSSAQAGFSLIISNGVRALVLNCLSGFLLFLSKLAVTCLSGFFAYLFVTNKVAKFFEEFNELHYYWGPLSVFIILSYILASSFFNVYEVAVDTIFLCYLEDCKVNDGTAERPYYMTKSLAKVLGQQNH